MCINTVYKKSKISKDVNEFVTLLIKDKVYFSIVCDIVTIIKRNPNNNNNNYTKEEVKIIENRIDDAELEYDNINYDKTQEFTQFKKLCIKIGIEGSAQALEELIYRLGPYNNSTSYETISTREAPIRGFGKSNFDVIFCEKPSKKVYDGNDITIREFGEFHECKRKISNVIPNDFNTIDENILNKLKFIKRVHDSYSKGKYFIPTFQDLIISQQECINNVCNGDFSFIKILGKKELLCTLYK